MKRRNTFQKELIKKAVSDLKSHVTADEIYEYIKKNYPRIGKGTIYRNLNLLVEDGSIRKIEIPNGPDFFDFTLDKHYHVKCTGCGKLFDVDMDEISDMENRIHDKHGFQFLSYDILFKGKCPKCIRITQTEIHTI